MAILYVLAIIEGVSILATVYVLACVEIASIMIQRENRQFRLEAKRAEEARYSTELGPYRGY